MQGQKCTFYAQQCNLRFTSIIRFLQFVGIEQFVMGSLRFFSSLVSCIVVLTYFWIPAIVSLNPLVRTNFLSFCGCIFLITILARFFILPFLFSICGLLFVGIICCAVHIVDTVFPVVNCVCCSFGKLLILFLCFYSLINFLY